MLKKICFLLLFVSFSAWTQRSNDCTDAIVVCGNSTIASNVSGFGTQELDNTSNPCFFEEVNSLWLRLNIAESGSLSFIITPDEANLSVDYDFYVFGPGDTCGNFNDPIRCSTTNPINAGLTNNLTGLRNTENDTSEGPGPDGNSFVSSLSVFAGETYYLLIDRPGGNGGFSLDFTGTSNFFEGPTVNRPENLELCIANPDTTIDLLPNRTLINNDQDTEVSLHTSLANAFDGLNAIENLEAFPVLDPNIVIYVRVEVPNGCFEITEFDITTQNYITDVFSVVLCDQDGDAMENFELTQIADTIRQSLDNPQEFDISFHLDEASADMAATPLTGPLHESGTGTIYARIASILDLSCFVSIPIGLMVESSPIPEIAQLVQCDVDLGNSTDGITALNLDQLFLGIADMSDFVFLFYESITDRDNDIPITNPVGYENTRPFDQTLYYRAINTRVGCENLGELQLLVQPTTVSLNPQSPFFVCDENPDDNQLMGTFDLENIRMVNYAGLEATFYSTLTDVTLEQNPVTGNFTTTSTTLFVRIENSNQCQDVEEIELVVNPGPSFDLPETYLLCTDNPPLTIIAPLGFDSYTWFKKEGNTEEVLSTTINVDIAEVGSYCLEAGLEYRINGESVFCTNRRNFEVRPSNIAVISNIIVEDISDNNTIQVTVSGDGVYEYSLDGENYQDSDFFDNVPSGLITVFVRDKNGCGISQEQVAVIGYPKFFTPNGDNINDFWQITGINDLLLAETVITIYDRFGKLIIQLRPEEQGWDGQFNNRQLPASDYWFKVNLGDSREFNGHFALKR